MSYNQTLDYSSLVSTLTDVICDDSFSLEEKSNWTIKFLAEQLGLTGSKTCIADIYDAFRKKTIEYAKDRKVTATDCVKTINNLRRCSRVFLCRDESLSYKAHQQCTILNSRFSEFAHTIQQNAREKFLSIKTRQEPLRSAMSDIPELNNAQKIKGKLRHPGRVTLYKHDGENLKTRLNSSKRRKLMDACEFLDEDENF